MALETTHEVIHELDDLGRETGVEAEQFVADDVITVPFDPRRIDVTTETRSLDVLMKRLAANQIDLDPDFQRSRGIWTQQKKSQLIESLLLRIPIPTFYVAEVESDEPDDDALGVERWAVVDGIQRLSTIAQFVQPASLGLKPLRLTGMQYLSREEGKSFKDLSIALQLRVLESQFTIQVIRRSTPEAVKLNIFARINTGGVPLSSQELRHALTPGPARALLRDLAHSPDFRNAVADSVSPARMSDREMVLRFLAFRLDDPATYRQQDFDRFLRDAMKIINSWDADTKAKHRAEFAEAMRVSAQIFDDDAFRKRYSLDQPRRPVSKALFEAVGVAIATVSDRGGDAALRRLVQRRKKVRSRFIDLMGDRAFDRSISQGTGDPNNVRYRFGQLIKLMTEVADVT